jgi:hypothetical protein
VDAPLAMETAMVQADKDVAIMSLTELVSSSLTLTT